MTQMRSGCPQASLEPTPYPARKRVTPSARAAIPLRATVMTSAALEGGCPLVADLRRSPDDDDVSPCRMAVRERPRGPVVLADEPELALRAAEPYQLLPRARRTAGHQQLPSARPPHDIEHAGNRAAVLLAAADIAVLRRHVDRGPAVALGLPGADRLMANADELRGQRLGDVVELRHRNARLACAREPVPWRGEAALAQDLQPRLGGVALEPVRRQRLFQRDVLHVRLGQQGARFMQGGGRARWDYRSHSSQGQRTGWTIASSSF